MKLSIRRQVLPWSISTGLAVLMLFMSTINLAGQAAPAPTQSRFATPLASPTNNGGNATWAVKQMSFVSHYPNGFDFTLSVSSSAGKITQAAVKWRHSTIFPNTALGTADDGGNFVGHWKPLTGQNIPQWVGVDYWWVVTDDQGNQFETPHGYIEYADNTRKWKRLVSDDAVIHWEASLPADLGTDIASALKRQRPFYMQAWGKLLDYKPQIVVYASYDPWKEWNPTIDNHVEGQTDPHWGTTVQVYRTDVADPVQYLADSAVLHEVEHLYQQTFGAYGSYLTAVWFFEGDATYLELYQPYDYLQSVKDLAAKGQLPTLAELSKRTAEGRTLYDVGYAFWKYLEVVYGPDTHRKVWEQIGKGQPIILALQTATGQKYPDLEANFRVWLGAS